MFIRARPIYEFSDYNDLHGYGIKTMSSLTYVTLDHTTKSLVYIYSNNQKYIVWVKIIDFSFMPKIIRILSKRSCSMKIFCKFPTINISKHNFWLVICIAKNFIWTTLKVIFSIFWFFAPSDSRFTNSCISAKYCSIITNHTSMESYLFSFQMMYKSQFRKMDPYDWFCAPGSHMAAHIYINSNLVI